MSDFFENLNISTPQSSGRKRVPNEQPTSQLPYKICFLGEAPGETEDDMGKPFVGASGTLLTNVMSQCGISRGACLMANVVQYRPENNMISRFPVGGFERTDSLKHLDADLKAFDPNLVVLLGDTAFRLAGFDPDSKKNPQKVSTYRGSLLQCKLPQSPLFGYKVLPTYHPAAVLRSWDWLPLFISDIRRAAAEGYTKDLNLPVRDKRICTPGEAVMMLEWLKSEGKPTALDIEGYPYNIKCISFANSPHFGFCIPLHKFDDKAQVRVLRAIASFLQSDCIKILQNGLYDLTCIALTYNIIVRNFRHDTMLGFWELWPELPKSLAVQTSILTREPYYKSDRKSDSDTTFFNYCTTDSLVTHEGCQAQLNLMSPSARRHYNFNIRLLSPLLYTQLRGIRYDKDRAELMRNQCQIQIDEVTQRLRLQSGNPKFNPASHKQVKELLYKRMRLPEQKKKEAGKATEDVTSSVPALLELAKTYQHPIIADLLRISRLLKRRSYLKMLTGQDGRMHCTYNIVGSKTGRLACSKSADGTGANIQTIESPLRVLFIADEGCEFFQCDLAGADGWTVAAYCKVYGDDRMFKDYLAGLKPAKILVLLFLKYMHSQYGEKCLEQFPMLKDILPFFVSNPGDINDWDRELLRTVCKLVSEDGPQGWLYFSCKGTTHATNYLTGVDKTVEKIALDSFKKIGNPIYVDRRNIQVLRDLYAKRYPGLALWQNACKYHIKNSRGYPEGVDASGHVRKFFGRKEDNETLRSFLAHEPQANTTLATNLALERLWTDRANRHSGGRGLLVEPLHQVHDALCGQWRIEDRERAIASIMSYFDNTLTIAGTDLVIPYDGGFGPSWGEAKNKFK